MSCNLFFLTYFHLVATTMMTVTFSKKKRGARSEGSRGVDKLIYTQEILINYDDKFIRLDYDLEYNNYELPIMTSLFD